MNKAYVIWPLIGLLVFGSYYWHVSKGFAERDRLAAVEREKERTDRALLEQQRKKAAIDSANKALEERKIARAKKDKEDEDKRLAREAIREKRDRTFDDVNRRLRPQLDRLKTDAEAIKQDISQLELQKKQYVDEETFLRGFVRTAEANVKTYTDLLEKIKVADDARAAADAAAAAKAKKD